MLSSVLDALLRLLMGKMTDDVQERRNVFWRTVAMLLTGASMALIGGDLWAGFLTKTGFSMTQIGLLGSVTTFSSAFGLLAFMGLADRIQNRIRAYALCVLATAIGPMVTIIIALVPRAALPLTAMFGALVVVLIGQTLVGAIPIMLDYPVLVRTISVGLRGRMFAILTTSFGILAIIMGLLSANVLAHVEYPMGYVWCFVAAVVAIVLRAVAFTRQRELPELAIPGASRSALPFAAIVDVLKMKEFQWLAGPHVLRGVSSAMLGFTVPLGMRYLGLSDATPGYATSVNYAAAVLGGTALGFIADRWGAGRSTLAGDILFALGLGTLLVYPHLSIFLVVLFFVHFGRNIEDTAVPFGCTVIVPPERMGAFSAARLMVMMGSSAIGGPIFGYLLDHCDPVVMFGIGAALKLINGLWFWWVFQLKPPVVVKAEPQETV